MFSNWGVTWRKAVVSLPRLVPDVVLNITSSEGPQPLVIQLPSRAEYKIPVYVFIPPSARIGPSPPTSESPSTFPVLIDFHGGGFVLGSCQEQAPFCAKLCRELQCVAISVDYRLGPSAQFPAALEDAEDVVRAVRQPGAPGYDELRQAVNGYLSKRSRPAIDLAADRIALSGFSSGGNIALNLVTNVGPPQIDKAWPCAFEADYPNAIPALLYYAALDLRDLPSARIRVPLMDEAPKGFFETLQLEERLMPTYLPKEKGSHPRASPLLANVGDGGLHSKAKVYLILAGKDNLSHQNEQWIKKAANEGRTDVRMDKYEGVLHGWTQFPDGWLDQHNRDTKIEAHNKAVGFVRDMWRGT